MFVAVFIAIVREQVLHVAKGGGICDEFGDRIRHLRARLCFHSVYVVPTAVCINEIDAILVFVLETYGQRPIEVGTY